MAKLPFFFFLLLSTLFLCSTTFLSDISVTAGKRPIANSNSSLFCPYKHCRQQISAQFNRQPHHEAAVRLHCCSIKTIWMCRSEQVLCLAATVEAALDISDRKNWRSLHFESSLFLFYVCLYRIELNLGIILSKQFCFGITIIPQLALALSIVPLHLEQKPQI